MRIVLSSEGGGLRLALDVVQAQADGLGFRVWVIGVKGLRVMAGV